MHPLVGKVVDVSQFVQEIRMSQKDSTIKERLAILETLLKNHLHHHEIYLVGVLIPMGIMIFLLLAKAYAPDVVWAFQFLH